MDNIGSKWRRTWGGLYLPYLVTDFDDISKKVKN